MLRKMDKHVPVFSLPSYSKKLSEGVHRISARLLGMMPAETSGLVGCVLLEEFMDEHGVLT